MARVGRARIGCSGWQYAHWRGDFYPRDLPHDAWLRHYARAFDTVEINNSFYKLPDARVVSCWREQVPARFLFAWKASRFLTHMKKLKDPEEPLRRMMERASVLQKKLGPILYQLPPLWKPNVERLQAFLRALPRGQRHAIEFRNAAWYEDAVLRALEGAGVALCLHDMPGSVTPRRAVGPFVYVRFHGAGAKYGGGYARAALDGWARRLVDAMKQGRDVYAYFNNDQGGHAPRDATTLKDLIARHL